jgi:NADH-quinone oxidoreductase subunit L
MMELLWVIVAIPFASACVLAVLGSHLSHRVVTAWGVGSIGVSAAISMLIMADFVSAPPVGHAYTEFLWT